MKVWKRLLIGINNSVLTFREYHEHQLILEDWASFKRAVISGGLIAALGMFTATVTIPKFDEWSKKLIADEPALEAPLKAERQQLLQTQQPPITTGVEAPPPQEDDTNATADQYFQNLAQDEGFRGQVYNDTGGNPTIGFGHHLNGSRQSIDNVEAALPGTSYEGLRAGTVTIDRDQARAIFDQDVVDHQAIARNLIPAFDDLPAEVEIALVNAAFRTDLQGSPTARGLMNSNQWIEAAAEYIDNDEYRASRDQGARHGVWQRMDRNAAAFRQHGENLNRLNNNR